jgi:hypothetical protein
MDRLGEGRLASPPSASEHQNAAGCDHLLRGFALTASFDWRYSVCGLISSDVQRYVNIFDYVVTVQEKMIFAAVGKRMKYYCLVQLSLL